MLSIDYMLLITYPTIYTHAAASPANSPAGSPESPTGKFLEAQIALQIKIENLNTDNIKFY